MNIRKLALFAMGPIVAALAGAITVPLIAWVFSPADVGRFGVLQMVTSLGVGIIFLGLDQAFVREYHEWPSPLQLYATTMWPARAVLLVVGVLVALWPAPIAQLLYGLREPTLAWGTLASLAVAVFVRELALVVRMQERGLAFSAGQVVPKLAMVAAVLLAAANAGSSFALLMALFVGSAALALIPLSVATGRKWLSVSPRQISRQLLRRILAYSIGLCAAAFVYIALGAVGTFALRAWSTFDELGRYSVALSIAGVAGLIQSIFTIVWAPILYRRVADGTHELLVDNMRGRALAITCLAFAACGALSWLIDFVLPPDFAVVKYLVIGTVAQPLLYALSEVSSAGIGVTRRSSIALAATSLGLATAIGLCAIAVPTLGARGAVIASAIAFWVAFVVKTESAVRIWTGFPRASLHSLTGTAVLLAVASVGFGSYLGRLVVIVWVVFGLASILVCRRAWIEMIKSVLARFPRYKRG